MIERLDYSPGGDFAGSRLCQTDFDRDGDVDMLDYYNHFSPCYNGPNHPYGQAGCEDADLDQDGDVDPVDFLAFQACFNGPNRPPANANCYQINPPYSGAFTLHGSPTLGLIFTTTTEAVKIIGGEGYLNGGEALRRGDVQAAARAFTEGVGQTVMVVAGPKVIKAGVRAVGPVSRTVGRAAVQASSRVLPATNTTRALALRAGLAIGRSEYAAQTAAMAEEVAAGIYLTDQGAIVIAGDATAPSFGAAQLGVLEEGGSAALRQQSLPALTSENMLGRAPVTAATGETYSVAYEMRLSPADLGRSRPVHFNRANAALDAAMQADPASAAQMERMIPGVGDSVSSAGGRATPSGWIWHHDVQTGVMQLVPDVQHTPGSIFWNTMHPNGQGGYSIWAIPAGAPPN